MTTSTKYSVHFILQGKGGVGKSFSAALLAQYIESKGLGLICLDTDPVNATFSQYKSLNVGHVDILDGTKIVQRKFDAVMEKIIETDSNFVIDNGASTFLTLTDYLAENGIIELLNDSGKEVFVHTIITAGQAKSDTLNGFEEITKTVKDNAKIVVWENEFWGPFELNGKSFTEMNLYQKNKAKVAGVVKIANRSSDTFITDIKLMTEKHLTLSDVKESDEFGIISKSRLHRVVNDVFAELDKVAWG
jgi:hypothetical protein